MENILITSRKDIEYIINTYGLNCIEIEKRFKVNIYCLQAIKENNTLTNIDIVFENSTLISLTELKKEWGA